jgi:hypothetical protein
MANMLYLAKVISGLDIVYKVKAEECTQGEQTKRKLIVVDNAKILP